MFILILRIILTILLLLTIIWLFWSDGYKFIKFLYKSFIHFIDRIELRKILKKDGFLKKISDLTFFKQKKIKIESKTPEQIFSEIVNLSLQEQKDIEKKLKNSAKTDKQKQSLINKILAKAEMFKKKGQLDKYEQKLIEGLAIDPYNIKCNEELATYYHNISEYKKAILILKKIIKADPKNHNAIWQLGDIYLTQGEFDIAEVLINKAISLDSRRPKYYISLVEIYYNRGNITKAIEYMHKAVNLRDRNTTYLMGLAKLYEEMGDVDNAKKYYFEILEIEPNNVEAKKKLNSL